MIEQKIKELKEILFARQASLVEEMVSKSVRSLVERNASLAREVIEKEEPQVNDQEIEIEESAINIMARYQPEASNLRTVVMILKINNDLERVGDHAVNIAFRSLDLLSEPRIKAIFDIQQMATRVTKMLKESLDSFVLSDADLAVQVCKEDSEVDAFLGKITAELVAYVASNPVSTGRVLKLILLSRDLERIADLATNIAEDVIFIVKGKVIKHHSGNSQD